MTLLILAAILTLAWMVSVILPRFRIPDIIGFLGIGLLFGPYCLRLVHISLDANGVGTAVALAASMLLYEGGRRLDLDLLRPAWFGLMLLVTAGVLVTAGLAAGAARLTFGWDWQTAALFGAVIASTDPAAIIPVMRQLGIAERVSNIAQAESALSDATGAMLTVVTLQVIHDGTLSATVALSSFAWMGLGGLIIGVVIALVTGWIAHGGRMAELDLGAHSQQVVELITVILAYGVATYVGSSGYMAAFAAGLVHSRTATHAAHSTEPFFTTVSFMSRLGVFVVLGATLNPITAAVPLAATAGFLVLFMFVVRPTAVLASLLPDRRPKWTIRELIMLSWVRETGVIPAALAANVAALAIPHADAIVSKTAAVIFVTVLVQGVTTGALARRLCLTT